MTNAGEKQTQKDAEMSKNHHDTGYVGQIQSHAMLWMTVK